jgi:hypothetical protein
MLCNECLKCSNCVKTCPAIEDYLKRQHIYSKDYIRPKISRLKRKDGKGKWREVPNSALSMIPEDRNPLMNNYDCL